MGNAGSQPKNKTGKKVVAQKLEYASKTGILSLSEHKLDEIPNQVFSQQLINKLKTLDLSKNNLKYLDTRIGTLTELKILNIEDNKLVPGSLTSISKLLKLQNLSLGNNQLGKPITSTTTNNEHHHHHRIPHHKQKQNEATTTTTTTTSTLQPLPNELSKSLKIIKLNNNYFSSIPKSILSKNLIKLEKLDLSYNNLASIPCDIKNLKNLQDLNLDNNVIVSLPNEIGMLTKLKVLSLRNNHINVTKTTCFNETTNPQPLPSTLFTNTSLIDLNLHGNQMTNTQLNTLFDGYKDFLSRREKMKTTALYGGALTNHDVCGLE